MREQLLPKIHSGRHETIINRYNAFKTSKCNMRDPPLFVGPVLSNRKTGSMSETHLKIGLWQSRLYDVTELQTKQPVPPSVCLWYSHKDYRTKGRLEFDFLGHAEFPLCSVENHWRLQIHTAAGSVFAIYLGEPWLKQTCNGNALKTIILGFVYSSVLFFNLKLMGIIKCMACTSNPAVIR